MRRQGAGRPNPHSAPAGGGDAGREVEADVIALRAKRLRPVRAMAGSVVGMYLLTTLLAGTAPGFMAAPIVGPLTVGLALILLQCATTAATIRWYARHAATRLDPLTDLLRAGEGAEEAVR